MENYILEIYQPNSADDVLITIKSSNPFLSFSRGDLINPRVWDHSGLVGSVLEVKNVEHIIYTTNDQVKHKVCIFTSEKDDTGQNRLS